MQKAITALVLALVSTGVLTMHIPAQNVTVRPLAPGGVPGPAQTVPKIVKTAEAWKMQLGPEVFAVVRAQGTERPFCGAFYDHKKEGVYLCVCCGLPLFAAGDKFDSGTGWPSFFQPFAKENVVGRSDASHGMSRTEVVCARCDAHLGHLFEDGPPPTGLRFCINSISLQFIEKADAAPALR